MVQPDTYNRLFTMHGVLMIFFFLIPSIPAAIGNFVMPLQIGAKDVAFPQAQPGELVHVPDRRRLDHVGADARRRRHRLDLLHAVQPTTYSNTFVAAVAVGIFINGFSSIFTGINFMVTIHRMRAPGLTWFRLPLFIWAHYATSLIMVLGTPVLAITIVLVASRAAAQASASSIPPGEAIRCSSSTSSGSIPTRRSTS